MNCTGERCIMQFDKVDPVTCTAVPYCPQATPPKTNADRIRAMTDEELADVIAEGFCSGRVDKCNNYTRCTDCTLDWLKEEVKDV